MNIKLFAKKFRSLNNNNPWIVLLISYFISILLSVEEVEGASSLQWEFAGSPIDYIVPVVISILCCISFYDKYLKTEVHYNGDDIILAESITLYMKYHGFPVEAYFSYIMKRFLPIQIIMPAVAIVISIEQHNIAKAVVSGIVFVIPFFVWQIRKAVFQYAITHRQNLWISLVREIINKFIWIISLVIVVMTFLMGTAIVYAVIENFCVLQNYDAASICFSQTELVGLMIAALFWPIILFSNLKILKKFHLKAVTTGVVMLIIVVQICSSVANHTILEENTILVTKNFAENKYTFEDVKSFEIFEDETETAIAMRFYCKNGETISVTMANYSNTEQWDRRYHNEYEFVKDVTTQLLENGTECSIREPEKLIQDMREYGSLGEYEDDENTLREIIEMLK